MSSRRPAAARITARFAFAFGAVLVAVLGVLPNASPTAAYAPEHGTFTVAVVTGR